MIEVTGPAAVLMTICETTLSDKICSILPGKRFRMLVLIMGDVICASRNAWVIGPNENKISYGQRHRASTVVCGPVVMLSAGAYAGWSLAASTG
jgi:hypothetical protein